MRVRWVGCMLLTTLLVLSMSCGSDDKHTLQPDPGPAERFVGEWIEDASTGGITKVVIRIEGEDIFVHMWGSCSPTDCDWGEVSTPVSDVADGFLSIEWTPSFCEMTQILTCPTPNRLKVESHTHYIDDSGRPDRDDTYYFHKAGAAGPAAVDDLEVSDVTSTSVALTWTAPGVIGSGESCSAYDLRYSTSAISEENWETATSAAGLPGPAAAGTQESYTVTGLQPGTPYDFGLKSRDEQSNWSPLSNTPTATTQSASGQGIVVVSTRGDGIWRTTNGGDSWSKAGVDTYWNYFGGLCEVQGTPGVLYAACNTTQCQSQPAVAQTYRSDDYGATWAAVSGCRRCFHEGASIISMASVQPDVVYGGTWNYAEGDCNGFYDQGGAFYRSEDGGSSWSYRSTGLPHYSGKTFHTRINTILLNRADPQRVIVGIFDPDNDTESNGLFLSTDAGASWDALPIGTPEQLARVEVYSLASDPTDPSRIVAATRWGVFLSEDAGASWSKTSDESSAWIVVYHPGDSQVVFTSEEVSTDGGQTWTSRPLPTGGSKSLAIDGDNDLLYAAGYGGVYRSPDMGVTWSLLRELVDCQTILVVSPD